MAIIFEIIFILNWFVGLQLITTRDGLQCNVYNKIKLIKDNLPRPKVPKVLHLPLNLFVCLYS